MGPWRFTRCATERCSEHRELKVALLENGEVGPERGDRMGKFLCDDPPYNLNTHQGSKPELEASQNIAIDVAAILTSRKLVTSVMAIVLVSGSGAVRGPVCRVFSVTFNRCFGKSHRDDSD